MPSSVDKSAIEIMAKTAKKYGEDIMGDPVRMEGLILDMYSGAGFDRIKAVLRIAVKFGIVQKFYAVKKNNATDAEQKIKKIVTGFIDRCGLQETNAIAACDCFIYTLFGRTYADFCGKISDTATKTEAKKIETDRQGDQKSPEQPHDTTERANIGRPLREWEAIPALLDAMARETRKTFSRRNLSSGVLSRFLTAGNDHTVGLRADGTVVAAGDKQDSQCNVSGWRDIVAVAAGFFHTVGLRADGTVVAVGNNNEGRCDVSNWKNIIALAAGGGHTVGLRADGTVIAVGGNQDGQCDVSGWIQIVSVAAGREYTVGLRADGTVVTVGNNQHGVCDVSGWKKIIAVATGWTHIVGLRADGTAVAVGNNQNGECDVSGWKNIVAAAAGNFHTIGLQEDGTVVAVGNNQNGVCDVSDWSNIVAVSAGWAHTVGLRADGAVVAAGNDEYDRCKVTDWNIEWQKTALAWANRSDKKSSFTDGIRKLIGI